MQLRSALCTALLAAFSFASLASAESASKLGRFVVVGDSLAAGFQNFSLFTAPNGGQPYGFAADVARQAGANLNLPTITYPGIPPAISYDPSTGMLSRAPGYGFRVNFAQTQNFSVPGYTLGDAISHNVDLSTVANPLTANPIDVLALTVLGIPSSSYPLACITGFNGSVVTLSSVSCAARSHADTLLVDLGNNDALQSVTQGLQPTDPEMFKAQYQQAVAVLAAGHPKLILTTIPDVSAVPFLIPVPLFQAKCGAMPQGATGSDFVVPNITDPNFSGNVCTDYAVRPASLIDAAQSAVTAYNGTIESTAAKYHAVVFDLNGLFAQISANGGYRVGPFTLTTAPFGGIFSLDSIHPTNTGYAIMANDLINTINAQWHRNIPPVSIEQVAAADPLVPKP